VSRADADSHLLDARRASLLAARSLVHPQGRDLHVSRVDDDSHLLAALRASLLASRSLAHLQERDM
jgi:hypothetical protein